MLSDFEPTLTFPPFPNFTVDYLVVADDILLSEKKCKFKKISV